MKSVRCLVVTGLMALGLAGAGAAQAAQELTEHDMDHVTAGALPSMLGNIGAIAVATSNVVATPFGTLVIGLNSSLAAALGRNTIYWNLSVTRL